MRSGCSDCAYIKKGLLLRKKLEQFIKEAIEKHGNKYTYELVNYRTENDKVKILCVFHKYYFDITPNSHLSGSGCGCWDCGRIKQAIACMKTQEQFINESIKIHGNKYTYELIDYKGDAIKVEIYCTLCKIHFPQTPHHHIRGQGCPYCCKLKSEKLMIEIFEKLCGYKFPKIRPNFLKNLETGKNLELDGYCKELKYGIEYNGIQHNQFHEFFHRGNYENFIQQQERDDLKAQLCKENGITLFIISHEYNHLNPEKMRKHISELLANHKTQLLELSTNN
jgi:hypothetical protein